MSASKSTRPTSLDATLNGRDICIEFDRVTTFSHDPTYGADADGNRSVPMDFVDEDDAEHITVWFYDDASDGQKVTPIAALSSLDALEVQRLVDDYLEHHEPEVPEEPERDWDSVNDEREDRRQDGLD